MKKDILSSIRFEKVQPKEDELLELYRVPSRKGTIEFVKLYENTIYPPHIHHHTSAHLFILSGKGVIILDKKKIHYKQRDDFFVDKAISHGFEVEEETIMLSIQSGEILDRKTGKIDIEYIE